MSSTITDGTKYNDFGAVSQSILKQKLISDVNLYKMVLLLPGDVKLSKIFLHHYYDDAGVSLNIKSNLDLFSRWLEESILKWRIQGKNKNLGNRKLSFHPAQN